MTTTAPAPSFAAASTRRLRAAGLSGKPVRVVLDGEALVLSGATSGSLRIEAALTERVRFGFTETKQGRYHVARIWPMGQHKPLILEPMQRGCWDYGAVMRGFAACVAARRGIGHVERGISGLGAAATLAFLMVPTLAYTAIAIALMERRDWMGWGAGLCVFWALGAVWLWLYFKRQRPRPVRDLAELNKQIPGPDHGL